MRFNGKTAFDYADWKALKNLIREKKYTQIFVLCDSNTERHCLPYLRQALDNAEFHVTSIPAGEESKSLSSCEYIWNRWIEARIDRKSLVLCLGGGVICDLGGFCASAVVRGVDFALIPTSLMAMADAAFGGKTAINLRGFKNQIGSFSLPTIIVLESDFLNTLPQRHWRNGYVEMFKHSLLDPVPYWNDMANTAMPATLAEVKKDILRSIRTKRRFAELDLEEKGIRRALNYGHTLGHACESAMLMQGRDVLHGEALAFGLICESWLSDKIFNWKAGLLNQIKQTLKPYGPVFDHHEEKTRKLILELVEFDKKRHGQTLQFSLLKKPGHPAINVELSQDDISKSLEFYAD